MQRGRFFLQHLFLCASQTAYRCRFALGLFGFATLAAAQVVDDNGFRSPVWKGSTEAGFTTGGGVHIAGGVSGGDFWTMQLRWGRVLTAPRGPGLLRGSLEYAFEVVPALVLFHSKTVFGGGFNPFLLQYNFAPGNRLVPRFIPFVQVGGGALFSTDEIPAGTVRFNFTPQGGFGVYWMHDVQSSLVFGVRYHHISNGGRIKPNPGHNALYFYGGLSWWR